MICPTCKSAGNENAIGNESIAALLHGACDNRCDCQHRTGQWRNERRDG